MQQCQGRCATGRIAGVAPVVSPAQRSLSHRNLLAPAVANAVTNPSTKLPASHLESSKKALEQLKQQAVNREW